MPDSPPVLAHLSDQQREQALTRFKLVQPFLEEGVALTQLAQQHGISLRTLQRWVAHYRQAGLVGLARQPRADRQQRRIDPTLKELIEGLALQTPAPTVASIHRRASAVARQQGWRIPSYATVHSIVQHLSPALVTLAHAGDKAYADRFDLIHRRDADHANQRRVSPCLPSHLSRNTLT